MLKSMFKKTYTKLDTKYRTPENAPEPAETGKTEESPVIPAGLWKKCNKCGKPIYTEDVRANFYICSITTPIQNSERKHAYKYTSNSLLYHQLSYSRIMSSCDIMLTNQ